MVSDSYLLNLELYQYFFSSSIAILSVKLIFLGSKLFDY